MKFFRANYECDPVGRASARAVAASLCRAKAGSSGASPRRAIFQSAFTMVEIAISLAIIGIALVAIVGVLPLGMNVQRENREATVINQDATVFIEAIRNGSQGLDDLTNYVYAVTNYWTLYKADGTVQNSGVNGYSYSAVSTPLPVTPYSSAPITNGANIIALMSTPQFIAKVYNPPLTNYPAVSGFFQVGLQYGINAACYSNHIIAYVRSISGAAVEKPPQDNDIVRGDSFSYRLYCVNASVATDTNSVNLNSPYTRQLAANMHELRLTFLWPQLPNGNVGSGRQTYRAVVGGQITTEVVAGNYLYFYQPQSFGSAP
jgi:prepilin-type N-terminal cleavage/methylation domain-containing protein